MRSPLPGSPPKSVGWALQGPAWPAPPGAVAVRAGKGAGEGWEAAVREPLREKGESPYAAGRLRAAGGPGGGPNWPPCAASSCSAARRAPNRSWSRSRRRRRRWCCPWGWCRGCCPSKGSWLAAGRSTGLSPAHALQGQSHRVTPGAPKRVSPSSGTCVTPLQPRLPWDSTPPPLQLTLLLQESVLPLEVVNVLLVRVVFPAHVLDVLCGFVQDLGPGCLLQ